MVANYMEGHKRGHLILQNYVAMEETVLAALRQVAMKQPIISFERHDTYTYDRLRCVFVRAQFLSLIQ